MAKDCWEKRPGKKPSPKRFCVHATCGHFPLRQVERSPISAAVMFLKGLNLSETNIVPENRPPQ